MRFEDLPVDAAVGAILAHSHRLGTGAMLKKGEVLTEDGARALAAAGVARVAAVRLDDGDTGEDEAAHRIAESIAGPNLTTAPASTGRADPL